MNSQPANTAVRRWAAGELDAARPDTVAVEEPMELRVAERSIAVLMRTPGHDRELAAGFLLTEGVIRTADDLLDIVRCYEQDGGGFGNVVTAILAPHVRVDFERLTRHVFSSSSCGVCGKATLDAVLQNFPPVTSRVEFDPAALGELPARLRQAQPGFDSTGGLHGCALFTVAGVIELVREDVGRHNAVDKVLGRALLDGKLPLSGSGLLLSGRISFELVQKALAAGISLIAGIGAPSSLAIECAKRGNVSLIGFLRADRFNVYTGDERLVDRAKVKA